jgi:hypothetical protein
MYAVMAIYNAAERRWNYGEIKEGGLYKKNTSNIIASILFPSEEQSRKSVKNRPKNGRNEF